MTLLSVKAPAKINLVLEVLGKRPDGYHELSLIFQTIGIYDLLDFYPDKGGPHLEISGKPTGLPQDDSNLVLQAAKLFFEEFSPKGKGVKIELTKNIPIAAGLGGGSSDAAATLLGLNVLFQTGLKAEDLQPLAEKLGSDVPFFLRGGTALGTGRGEVIVPLPEGPATDLVLVKPNQGLSTPAVYQSGKAQFTSGEKTRAFLGLLAERKLPYLAGSLFNGLEPATFFLAPETQNIKKQLMEAGAVGALVSGSGPTVFGMAASKVAAEKIAERLRGENRTVIVTQTISKEISG